MPVPQSIPVKNLRLDLSNYRTVKQTSELNAVKAMIAISPDYFWALMESLAEDGYLPTDTIIVLKTNQKGNTLTVKEGNRRVAAMKVLHGLIKVEKLNAPASATEAVKSIDANWLQENSEVPCAVFEPSDALVVDRIVTLAHGKGEKAGRDQWNPVARSRHNRDVNKRSEPGLDLLEKYLAHGMNLTGQQKERWSGQYPLSVLDEAIKRISVRLGAINAPDLAKSYPNISFRNSLEEILRDIGLKILGFDTIRKVDADFAAPYGIPGLLPVAGTGSGTGTGGQAGGGASSGGSGASGQQTGGGGSGAGGTGSGTGGSGPTGGAGSGSGAGSGGSGTGTGGNSGGSSGTAQKPKAFATTDPKFVTATLKAFAPAGNNRQKVVVLRDEALKLKLKDNPLAFCFLLRSMFEISAKAYCGDHQGVASLSLTLTNGKDKPLATLLGDVAGHIAGGNFSSPLGKTLHGAKTELQKKDGLLSVTSMNALVHNPKFLVAAGDISMLFGNVYPLLEAMN